MALLDYALTTVNRCKAYLGLSSLTAAEEAVLENVINMVTNFVESYCGRRFMQTAYSGEEYDGAQDERLILNNYPVASGETFTFQWRDSASNEAEWETEESEDYFVKYDEGIINLTGRTRLMVATLKYRVDYTAGYDYDNVATFLGDTEAGDLEMAVWMLIASQWFKRKGSPDVKSERIGDYAITYGGSMEGLLKDGSGQGISMVQATLDKYRRWEVESVLTPLNS